MEEIVQNSLPATMSVGQERSRMKQNIPSVHEVAEHLKAWVVRCLLPVDGTP
jgi:hypothetical protein